MALFKIEKGLANNLATNRPNTNEGWCYFTTDDGKFYIDINTKQNDTSGRILLNAGTADKVTNQLTITQNGSSKKFDGSSPVSVTINANTVGALPNTISAGNENTPIYFSNGTALPCTSLSYLPLSGGTVTGNITAPTFIGDL